MNADFADKTILCDQASLIDRIAAFGSLKIHQWFIKKQHIQNVSLFDVHCGLEKSLGCFFEDEAGKAVKVNGERYRVVMSQFFVSQ